MELKPIRAFLALAEHRDPARAAREIGVQPPTFGGMLESLERELGIDLFDKSRPGFHLTENGRAFHERITPLIIGLERAIADTVAGSTPRSPAASQTDTDLPLRYTLPTDLGLDWVAEAIAQLETETTSFPLSPARAQIGLLQNSLDLVFGPLPVRPAELMAKPVGTAHWTLVLPGDHVLAGNDTVPVESLTDLPLIFFEREQNPDHYDATRARFERATIPLRVRMDASEPETALQMVADGLGAYLVENYVYLDLTNELVRKQLTGEAAEIVLGAIWHSENPSSAIPHLLDSLSLSPIA